MIELVDVLLREILRQLSSLRDLVHHNNRSNDQAFNQAQAWLLFWNRERDLVWQDDQIGRRNP